MIRLIISFFVFIISIKSYAVSSSLEVCNLGIKHHDGRQGHIDNDLGTFINSGSTETTHDFVTFTFKEINTDSPNQNALLEAYEDSFNSPWGIETSFQRKILNASFNFASENMGAEMFVDFCYIANGNEATSMFINVIAPVLIQTNAEMSCEFINLGFVPLNLSPGENNWSFVFEQSPSRCLVRVYGKESTTEIRNWAIYTGLFNISKIQFIEPTI